MSEKTIRSEIRERFGLTERAAHFAFLQASKTVEDKRANWERYQAAGFKAQGAAAKANAARMLADANVQEAVAYAREKLGTHEAAMAFEFDSAKERAASLARLRRTAEGSLGKVLKGELIMTPNLWRSLSDDEKALFSELDITVGEGKDGKPRVTRIKYKLRDASRAESQMADLEGWGAPKVIDHQGGVPIEGLDELRDDLRVALKGK